MIRDEVHDALHEILDKFDALNHAEETCGLSRLEDADRTWNFWFTELQARVTALTVLQEPHDELVDSLGALVVAIKVRMARLQQAQIHTGEAA